MATTLYMDVHVPRALSDQLRRRGVDVLTAIEDQRAQASDEELLSRCMSTGRVVVTFDVRFKAMAEDWQRAGRKFSGLVYAHPMRISLGQLVADLELIAKATGPTDWMNKIEYLPL